MSHVNKSEYVNVVAIVSCEVCDRVARYGIGASLILFLRSEFGYTTDEASTYFTLWWSSSYLFALCSGYISDVYWGKQKIILIGAVTCACALTMISLLTYIVDFAPDELSEIAAQIMFWIALYTMMAGVGGIRSSVGLLGVAQLEIIANPIQNDDHGVVREPGDSFDGQRVIESYWNWFKFAVNMGSLISYTVISYLCQEVSFAIGWSIPTISILLAIALFIWRKDEYYEPDTDADQSILRQFGVISWYGMTHQSRKQEIINQPQHDEYEYHWLDAAKLKHHGPYSDVTVEEIKAVYSVFGFLPFMAMYWFVYTTTGSLFYSQGCQMDYYIGSFELPIAALNVMLIIAILILIPFCDRLLYPFLMRTSYCNFGMLRKIGVGYFLLILTMITAGLVEIQRKRTQTLSITSTCDSSIHISGLSILWQIPQYFLAGASEVFADIVSVEFFSSQAPESMKAIVYSLNLVVIGVGYLMATLLQLIVDLWTPEWITNNLNHGHLEYYFFFMAGILLLNLLVYIPYARRYTYKSGTDVWGTEAVKVVDDAKYTAI